MTCGDCLIGHHDNCDGFALIDGKVCDCAHCYGLHRPLEHKTHRQGKP